MHTGLVPRASPALSIRSLPDYHNGRPRGRTNARSSRDNWTLAKDLIAKKQMHSRSLVRAADGSEFQSFIPRLLEKQIQEQMVVYVTFRLNFHHFDRFELDLRGHIHVRGAALSCLRLKWADIVLI